MPSVRAPKLSMTRGRSGVCGSIWIGWPRRMRRSRTSGVRSAESLVRGIARRASTVANRFFGDEESALEFVNQAHPSTNPETEWVKGQWDWRGADPRGAEAPREQ